MSKISIMPWELNLSDYFYIPTPINNYVKSLTVKKLNTSCLNRIKVGAHEYHYNSNFCYSLVLETRVLWSSTKKCSSSRIDLNHNYRGEEILIGIMINLIKHDVALLAFVTV